MNRLGIYVQVPFCQTKCTYCNFHTGVVSAARFAPYVAAVCREIAGHRALLAGAGSLNAPCIKPIISDLRRVGVEIECAAIALAQATQGAAE